jgi:hypothetical protein
MTDQNREDTLKLLDADGGDRVGLSCAARSGIGS